MASVVVQNNSNILNRQSFFKSALVGGTFAYVAKWAIPITPQEKEDVFLSEEKQLEENEKVAKSELELIRKKSSKIADADNFLHLYDEKKLKFTENSEAGGGLSGNLAKLYKQVVLKIQDAKQEAIDVRTIHTKGIRPAAPFIIGGAFIGLLVATVHNINYVNAKKHAQNA